MYVFASKGHIFNTTSTAKLDYAMEDYLGWGNGLIIFIICTFHSYFKTANTEYVSTELTFLQQYHPAAQDWLHTEAKQGWAWSAPGWETSLGCC